MATTHPKTEVIRPARQMLPAAALLAGAALALLNSTVSNVALPAMQADLQLSSAGVSWALAGWALTYALALIPAGRLGDLFGQRRMYLIGISAFVAASIGTGLVQNEAQLIVARLIQGGAGGLFYPAVAASLSLLYRGHQRGRVFGALGATIGGAAAVGPLLGGLLLEAFGPSVGWRAVFFLNLPLGLLILVAARSFLPPLRSIEAKRGFDMVGFFLLVLALCGGLIPLIVGGDLGWTLWRIAVVAAGTGMMVAFILWERRAEHSGRPTILTPSMFRDRDFTVSAALGFTQFAGFISVFYVLALLWQTGLGRSAIEMGLLTLPEALASVAGAAAVAALTRRWGSRAAVISGAIALSAGIGSLTGVLALVPASELSTWHLMIPLLITGVGSGISISATLDRALASVEESRSGAASGMVATLQRVGNAVGLALIGGVFFAVLAQQNSMEDDSYALASVVALSVCTAITFAGVPLSLLLRRTPKRP